MTRHAFLLGAVFVAALAVSVSAIPAKTALEKQIAWADDAPPQTVQSAEVHDLVGASVHAFHAGF